MFELTHQLAQEIVDRAMTILPHNVNVMDSQGLILASGDRARIDTRHEGAQLAIANGRVVEIDEHGARQLQGVQAGINLPLWHDDRLVGVLGISGDPQQLRTYAELVRMTAEMLVAQNHRQAEQQWRQHRSEDLLSLLLSDAGDVPRLVDEARQLGLKPQLPRTPYLIELHGAQLATSLAEWLTARYPDSWCVTQSASTLLWCCATAPTPDPQRLLDRLAAHGWEAARIAVGNKADDLALLRSGCRRLAGLLSYAQAMVPDESVLPLARYRLAVLLWTHRDDEALQELLAPVKRIQARDPGGHLLRTLRAWCEHFGQSQPCADALGIHRNSLRYRLERITELSGVDLLRLDGWVDLYLGVQLVRRKTDENVDLSE